METKDLFDKLGWGAGPWVTEPDWALWTDEATGLRCMIRRAYRPVHDGGTGALCGYVEVPVGHPWHKVIKPPPVVSEDMPHNLKQLMASINERDANELRYDYNMADVSVHGGLTWAGDLYLTLTPAGEAPGDQAFFLGFDCSHGGDAMPAMEAMLNKIYDESPENGPRLPKPVGYETYRTFEYVQNECRELARQIQEHAHDERPAKADHDYSDDLCW